MPSSVRNLVSRLVESILRRDAWDGMVQMIGTEDREGGTIGY